MLYGRPAKKSLHFSVPRNRVPAFMVVCSMVTLFTAAPARAAFISGAFDSTEAEADTIPIEDEEAVSGEPLWTKDELKDALERQSGIIAEEEQTWENTKSSKTAMLCAVLVPGLGQLYNERPFKALIAFGVETFYLSQIALNKRYAERQRNLRDSYDYNDPDERAMWDFHDIWATEYDESAQDYIWWTAGVIAIIVLDAYVDAHLHDMKIEAGRGMQEDEVTLMLSFRF